MALTDSQKAAIRLYLGYSDHSRSSGGHRPLEGALLALSAEAETQVGVILTALAAIDTDLGTVESAARAGIKSVDNGGVVWADTGRSATVSIENRGRRYVGRLSTILGVPVARDVYGSGIPTSGPCGRG